MNDLFEAVEKLERDLQHDHRPFSLFALVLRTRGHGKWDLVAAAPWLDADDASSRRAFARKVAERLPGAHLLKLSRAVVVAPQSEVATAFRRMKEDNRPASTLNHSGAFGFEIKDAYIITADSPDPDEIPA